MNKKRTLSDPDDDAPEFKRLSRKMRHAQETAPPIQEEEILPKRRNRNKRKYIESETEDDEEEVKRMQEDSPEKEKDTGDNDYEIEDEGQIDEEDEGENDQGVELNDDEYESESDVNEDCCFICRDVGRLICCDNCSKAFHLKCLKQKKVPHGVWQCPYCHESNNELCRYCHKSTKTAELKFNCVDCFRPLHFECLKMPLELVLFSPINTEFSFRHLNKENILRILFDRLDSMLYEENKKIFSWDTESEELFDEIKNYIKENQLFYICPICVRTTSVNLIMDSIIVRKKVSEKPAEGGEPVEEVKNTAFYLYKQERASYCRSVWVPESVIEVLSSKKLKNFKEIYGREEQTFEKSEYPFNIDFFKINRIIASKKPLIKQDVVFKYRELYETIFVNQEKNYSKTVRYGGKNNFRFFVKWESQQYEDCTWEDEFVILRFKPKLKYFLEIKMREEALKVRAKELEISLANGSANKVERRTSLTRRKSPVQHQNQPIFNPSPLLHPYDVKRPVDNNKKLKFSNNAIQQPEYLNAGTLHQYQLQGVAWLVDSWKKKNNVILADEMGLGKTVQTLCFLKYLEMEECNMGPFLVVAPSTTLMNWERESSVWCPNFNTVVYFGNQESREIIRRKEFYLSRKCNKLTSTGATRVNQDEEEERLTRFNIIVTGYESAMIDLKFLKKINWQVIVTDEAQRLKNNESKFFKMSRLLKTRQKILLTGTPIQNSIMELINLIDFINPAKAKNLKTVEKMRVFLDANRAIADQKNSKEGEEVTEEEKQKAINELTQIMKPHILRRVKDDVQIQLPELEEVIVKINLSEEQIFYYKKIFLKNYDVLRTLDKNKVTAKVSLHNILINLRLVCNHPYLFAYRRDFPKPEKDRFREDFIESSNKLKFLERLLSKLLEKGHKTLIFSQFKMMLDILEVFLQFKGWVYERLDGSTNIIDRQKIIDVFNSSTAKAKIFLLSTRAGGLGINLTAADTVIFTDSDFNPYKDIQAISRAHRIGQKKRVKVFRLVSKHTAEERIIEIATKKLLLEEIIINPINKFTKEDLESMLKNGTFEMFNKNIDEKKDQEFSDEQIESLLSRGADIIMEDEGDKKNIITKNNINNYYLSGFKFQSLSFQSLEDQNNIQDDKEKQMDKNNKYWENLLSTEAEKEKTTEMDLWGKGKRVKKLLSNNFMEGEGKTADRDDDSNYSQEPDQQESDEDDEKGLVKETNEKSDRPTKRSVLRNDKIVTDYLNKVLNESQLKSLDSSLESDLRILKVNHNFTEFHRREFLQFVVTYGCDYDCIDTFWENLTKKASHCFDINKGPVTMNDFKNYLKEFYAILHNFQKYPNNIVFCGVNAELIFKRILGLIFLKRKLSYYAKKPDKFKIHNKSYHKFVNFVDKNKSYPNDWTNLDDFLLFKGIINDGYDNWRIIMEDPGLWVKYKEEESQPTWKYIFRKIDNFPPESVDPEKAIEFIEEFMKTRANNLILLLLERDNMPG